MDHTRSEPNSQAILPAEIWVAIFRAATGLPDDTLYPPECLVSWEAYTNSLMYTRLKKMPVTKRAAAQACKAWNAQLTPLLYEHIILENLESFDSALKCLSQNPHLGAMVQRLDLLTEDLDNLPPFSKRIQFAHQLELLLLTMPNLRILVIPPMPWLYFSLYLSLQDETAKGASSRLECIRWLDDETFNCKGWSGLYVTSENWSRFLDAHPNLKSIQPPYVRFPPSASNSKEDPHLPIVHTTQSNAAVLSWTAVNAADSSRLPGIEDTKPDVRLAFKAKDMYDLMLSANTLPILKLHGHLVASVHFFTKELLCEIPGSVHRHSLRIIEDACPNLRELWFSLDWLKKIKLLPDDTKCGFPQLTGLSIQHLGTKYRWLYYRHMLDFVLEAREKLPSLRTVRFLNERDVIHLERNRKWLELDKFIGDLRKGGVTVDDGERML